MPIFDQIGGEGGITIVFLKIKILGRGGTRFMHHPRIKNFSCFFVRVKKLTFVPEKIPPLVFLKKKNPAFSWKNTPTFFSQKNTSTFLLFLAKKCFFRTFSPKNIKKKLPVICGFFDLWVGWCINRVPPPPQEYFCWYFQTRKVYPHSPKMSKKHVFRAVENRAKIGGLECHRFIA